MAAKTTVKVATLSAAAKDDVLSAISTGLSEDSLSATLDVLANDPGSAWLYSLYQTPQLLAGTTQFPVVTSATLASGATITIRPDGTLGYDASALNLQHLAQGALFTDTFVYTARMANGALSTASVTVQIAGMNDAPTLATPDGAVILDDADAAPAITVTGQLAGHDVDDGAVLSYSLAGGDGTSGPLGNFTLAADGSYQFDVNSTALDAMAKGEEADLVFSAIVTDEFGANSDPVDIHLHFVGANDTASIGGGGTGIVAEDGVLGASGALQVSDRDANQSRFQAVDPDSLHGVYGDFTFDADTGDWTYTLRNGDANVQALNTGDTVEDSLVVTSLDGTASKTIVVSIAGADEVAGDPSTRYLITHGRDQSTHNVFTGFDANDVLAYTPNLDYWKTELVGGDTVVYFTFGHGPNTVIVDAVLVGFTGLDAGQVQLVNA